MENHLNCLFLINRLNIMIFIAMIFSLGYHIVRRLLFRLIFRLILVIGEDFLGFSFQGESSWGSLLCWRTITIFISIHRNLHHSSVYGTSLSVNFSISLCSSRYHGQVRRFNRVDELIRNWCWQDWDRVQFMWFWGIEFQVLWFVVEFIWFYWEFISFFLRWHGFDWIR